MARQLTDLPLINANELSDDDLLLVRDISSMTDKAIKAKDIGRGGGEIEDKSVTNQKLADGAVSAIKIGTDLGFTALLFEGDASQIPASPSSNANLYNLPIRKFFSKDHTEAGATYYDELLLSMKFYSNANGYIRFGNVTGSNICTRRNMIFSNTGGNMTSSDPRNGFLNLPYLVAAGVNNLELRIKTQSGGNAFTVDTITSVQIFAKVIPVAHTSNSALADFGSTIGLYQTVANGSIGVFFSDGASINTTYANKFKLYGIKYPTEVYNG